MIGLAFLICLNSNIYAQGLERNAQNIKDKFPTEYQNTIRKHAVDKWKTDHGMIVYEINQQANALSSLINKFESENTNIAFQAIQKWSHDGYKQQNISKFQELETFGLKQLIPMHCDWSMVEYEYDNQVEAKGAY